MKPNSGSSIKDAINRIEKRLTALEEKENEWKLVLIIIIWQPLLAMDTLVIK
jgi:hypothetical protein